jgi:hypothetical protein
MDVLEIEHYKQKVAAEMSALFMGGRAYIYQKVWLSVSPGSTRFLLCSCFVRPQP